MLRIHAISCAVLRKLYRVPDEPPLEAAGLFSFNQLFSPSLPLSTSGKGECKINKGVRSITSLLLLHLEECVFQGSSKKENDWSHMDSVVITISCKFLLQRGERGE